MSEKGDIVLVKQKSGTANAGQEEGCKEGAEIPNKASRESCRVLLERPRCVKGSCLRRVWRFGSYRDTSKFVDICSPQSVSRGVVSVLFDAP